MSSLSVWFRYTAFSAVIFGVIAMMLFVAPVAQAAITVQGPPIDAIHDNITVGGGAIIPLAKFFLTQSSGVDTLTKVGFTLNASTTITQGQIARVSLWKESGAHPDLQINEDTFVAGAASTSPMVDGTLIVLTPTAAVSIGSAGNEFYVVATTSAVSSLTIGNGFDIRFQNNYASTSAGGIGNAFSASKKVTFDRSATLKISEVKAGATGNAADEFIELYNVGEVDINLRDLPLNLHAYYANGSSTPIALTYFNQVIPHKGYFLIASPTGYSGTAAPDAIYMGTSSILVANGGFSIATSSGLAATSTAIDRIGWGTQPASNGEGTIPATLPVDKSYERKATTSATATTMATGNDSAKGNGLDKNNNNLDNNGDFVDEGDFVQQSGSGINPQNSMSPHEFSFGHGQGQDLERFFVGASYPANGQTNLPLDLTFIGFNFNKVVATGTMVSATATTSVTFTGAGSSANLCTSTSYNPFPSGFEPSAKCNLSANLSPSTTYTFSATSSIRDLSGNALDQDGFIAGSQPYSITFTTGGTTQVMTNTTPPAVLGATPFPGSINIPTNLLKGFMKFSQKMDVSTLNATTITFSGGNLSSFSFDATTTILSFTLPALSANTNYTFTVGTGVKNSNNIGLPGPYISTFITGSAADYTAPTVVGVIPAPGTTLSLNSTVFVFSTDDHLDPTTATSGVLTLSSGGANLPGTVSYDPVQKEAKFTATNLLPGNVADLMLTIVGGAVKNITGSTSVVRTYVWSTEASNSDTAAPQVLFANADEFGVSVTFNESIKTADAESIANYTMTIDGNPFTLSALAGHRVTYDTGNRTAKISGVFLPPNAQVVITALNVKDISGNLIAGSNSFTCTSLSKTFSGGILGPGEGTGNFGPQHTDFSASGIGFMPGVGVMPMNAFIKASTTYGFDIPITKQVPADGTIVITFPSSSDFGLCCVATSTTKNVFINEQNKDINGQGPGTIGIKTLAKDNSAKTVTLTLDTATRSESGGTHDLLRFAVNDIKNPSIPKGVDSSGYTIDIKTKNALGALIESFSSNPIFISGGAVGGSATTTIRGTVSGNGGDLEGVTIKMMSPQTGMLEAVTNGSGVYEFTDVSANNQISAFGGGGTEYYLFTDPFLTPTGTTTAFFGDTMPKPASATSTSIVTRNFSLTPTSSAINFDVKLTGNNLANAIFKAGEQIDVFAGGPAQFIVRTYTTTATNYSATTIVTIPIPQTNGRWGIGVGPAMPKGMGSMDFGPPPSPQWVVPKPVEVEVSGCPTACTASIEGSTVSARTFTVSAANKTISGILKDGSGNVISSSMVFAFSPAQGIGNFGQTSPTGIFSIKVSEGSYNVGSFVPGMGGSREVPVTVKGSDVFVDGSSSASTGSSGTNPFVLTMTKPSYTITGQMTDGTNPMANASVFSYRTDGPGHAEAMTDSSGNYTLYVDNGAWRINSFIPGFGPMPEQSATISGASKSGVNFSPSTSLTYRALSGIVFESADAAIATSTEGVSGVVVRVAGTGSTSGFNEAITGSDGTFTLRVPSGTYKLVDVFKHGYGKIPPLDHALTAIGTLDLSGGDLYKPIRINARQTVTITVKDSSGAALVVPQAFIDLFDLTKNFGNHADIRNGTTTTVQLANGASTSIRAFIQGVPPSNILVASDDAVNTLVLDGVLQVNGAEKIKITVNTNTAALSTVSGTVYAGSAASGNELADAWVQFVDPTNNVHFGTQATSSGIYSLKIANGTYQVQAMKPGYISTPAALTVSANTSVANVVVTQAGASITGSITAGGSAASDAFVWAEKLGGGFASTKTNTAGTYTLPVDSGQWKVFAAAEGYTKIAYASNPVSTGASGISIALTSTASGIESKTATSNTFSDASVGSFTDSTLGIEVSLDSGALGSAGNPSYLTAKETSNFAETLDSNIVGDKAWDIDAVNGSSAVTNLQTGKTAEVNLTLTKAELALDSIDTTTEVSNVKIASWSDDKKAWESLTTVATYKDSSGDVVASPSSNLSNVASVEFTTTAATHFSNYALSSPSNADAPATPSGLTATQSSTNKDITISWTANTESDLSGYFLYRDTGAGTFPLLRDNGNTTSYTDPALTQGNTYSYKVSAFDTTANESAASGGKSVTIEARGGGGGVVSGGGGGGPSSPAVVTPTSTPTPALVASPAAGVPVASPVAPLVAKPSVIATIVSPVFNKDLSFGNRSDDVRRLQELLKQDSSIYPEGTVSGYFGPATRAAVRQFQKKYGLPQVGRVGPATRAKLQEIFGTAAAAAPITSEARQSLMKTLQDQIKALQIKLLEMQLKLLEEQSAALQKK